MNKRIAVLALLPAIALGAALLAARPVSSDHRLAPAAHKLDDACGELVEVMVESAHHQGEGREDAAEVQGIMSAGSLAGQVHAFHGLVEKSDESNINLGAAHVFRSLDTSRRAIVRAHISREVRDAWNDVEVAARTLDRQMGGSRRRLSYAAH